MRGPEPWTGWTPSNPCSTRNCSPRPTSTGQSTGQLAITTRADYRDRSIRNVDGATSPQFGNSGRYARLTVNVHQGHGQAERRERRPGGTAAAHRSVWRSSYRLRRATLPDHADHLDLARPSAGRRRTPLERQRSTSAAPRRVTRRTPGHRTIPRGPHGDRRRRPHRGADKRLCPAAWFLRGHSEGAQYE